MFTSDMLMTRFWHVYATFTDTYTHAFMTCLWHVYDMFTTPLWHISDMFTTWLLHIYNMVMTCLRHVYNMINFLKVSTSSSFSPLTGRPTLSWRVDETTSLKLSVLFPLSLSKFFFSTFWDSLKSVITVKSWTFLFSASKNPAVWKAFIGIIKYINIIPKVVLITGICEFHFYWALWLFRRGGHFILYQLVLACGWWNYCVYACSYEHITIAEGDEGKPHRTTSERLLF